MSTLTVEQAVDTLYEAYQLAWGDPSTIGYENKSFTLPHDKAWTRPFVRHVLSRQATLTDDSGYKRYKVTGNLIGQLFFPLGKGLDGAYNKCEDIVNLLRKHRSQVTLTNITWEEVGPDGKFYQFKLTAQFEYSQVR